MGVKAVGKSVVFAQRRGDVESMDGRQLASLAISAPGCEISMKSIHVHIDELVLHGLAPGDRRQIVIALEQELARLLGEQGVRRWRPTSVALERVNAGAFRVKAGARPEAAGTQIARAVFRSLRHHAGMLPGAAAPRSGVRGRP